MPLPKPPPDLQQTLEDLLAIYGGETVLRVLGKVLQTVEGAGNAAVTGKIIETLAELDW